MEAIAFVSRLVDRMLQALDLLDFLWSPLRHWQSWRETTNPVQFWLACFTGLAVVVLVGFWAAGRFGGT
jgi:hypothetical protein